MFGIGNMHSQQKMALLNISAKLPLGVLYKIFKYLRTPKRSLAWKWTHAIVGLGQSFGANFGPLYFSGTAPEGIQSVRLHPDAETPIHLLAPSAIKAMWRDRNEIFRELYSSARGCLRSSKTSKEAVKTLTILDDLAVFARLRDRFQNMRFTKEFERLYEQAYLRAPHATKVVAPPMT